MKRTVPSARIRAAIVVASGLLLAGCSMENSSAPALTGPSEFALSVTLSASPDQVPRDGSSQSMVTVTVRDASGRPVASQELSMSANIGSVSPATIVTGTNGQATVGFTAPSMSTVGEFAVVSAIPAGTNAGNSAVPRTVSILLTGVANSTRPTFPDSPNPPFTFTPAAPERNVSIRFDASSVRDEGAPCLDKCSYFWNFGDGTMDTGRIVNHTFLTPGTFNVALTVMDAAGAMASAARAVTVANVPAPTVTLAVTPNPPSAGHDATLTATATPAAGHGIVRYAWAFGDGRTATTTGPSVTTIYAQPGTYVATVTATDDLGQSASASLRFTIGGSGVTADITVSPTQPTAGATVQFNGGGSSGSAGSAIVLWSWDFGDGATFSAAAPTASHAYGAAGTYTVRLTVTDASGRTGTGTTTVAVQ